MDPDDKNPPPDTFEEARSSTKRFSTPNPQRVTSEKKLFRGKSTSDLKSTSGHGTKSKNKCSWLKNGAKVAEEWIVDLSKLFLGLNFAHGAHSQLYHGVYKDEPVAVKVIRVPEDEENEELGVRLESQFNKEIILLSRLHHPNVIKFVAACSQPPVFIVITEYLSEGSLRTYLHKLGSLPLKDTIKMALDIARGMEYVHSKGIIHRDLKPENILLSEDFRLKIADFGIGCEEVYCDFVEDDPGTYRWMAPEMIKGKSYGRKVDVYGFGLILWEMVAGSIPYAHMTPIQAAFAVVHKKLRPPIPADCPPAMAALMEHCWSSNPEKRPEFRQITQALEEFETFVSGHGNLNLLPHPTYLDKKGKCKAASHHHQYGTTPMPKPRFS